MLVRDDFLSGLAELSVLVRDDFLSGLAYPCMCRAAAVVLFVVEGVAWQMKCQDWGSFHTEHMTNGRQTQVQRNFGGAQKLGCEALENSTPCELTY